MRRWSLRKLFAWSWFCEVSHPLNVSDASSAWFSRVASWTACGANHPDAGSVGTEIHLEESQQKFLDVDAHTGCERCFASVGPIQPPCSRLRFKMHKAGRWARVFNQRNLYGGCFRIISRISCA